MFCLPIVLSSTERQGDLLTRADIQNKSSRDSSFTMAWVVNWIKELLSSFLSGLGLLNKEANLIIIGLDNAGKSTLLHKMAKNAFGSFAPTEKPTFDEFQAGGMTFKAWDLGGHEAVRQVWDDFMLTTDGVVFLVDSADRDRLSEVAFFPSIA